MHAAARHSVLIVDDVISNIKLLAAILRDRDFDIYEATSGQEALEIAEQKQPTIAILDVMMPEMDGFAVCQKLKENPRTRDIAVIYISAKGSVEDKTKGLEIGAVDYIVKPFQKSEVLARIDTHIALQAAKISLKESELKYTTMVENIQDGIFLWAPQKGVFFSNPAFRALVGKHDATQDSCFKLKELVARESLKRFEAELAAAIEDERPRSCEIHVKFLRPGSEDGVQASCLSVNVKLSGETAALVTVRDMTERGLLEHHLSHAQKMEALGLLTSGIAHDFNNILAIVNGYAELALLELGPDSPVTDKVKHILSAGKNAVSLTRSLLSFSRSKGMETEPVELGSEIRRVHSLLSRSFPKAVEFHLELPDSKTPVMADPGMLQQLLVNLCINARDAMPSGGRLAIDLRRAVLAPPQKHGSASPRPEADYAVITVSDTGDGIPDKIKSKIFDPFFTTKPEGKGSGLGLSIADRIARNHKGWISFDSVQGSGSKFKIHLPVAKGLAVAEEQPLKSYRHAFRKDLDRILVVDDDPAHVELVKFFLEKEGYDVEGAYDAPSAIEILEDRRDGFKLVILDQLLPKVNNQELSKLVAAKWPMLKVLVMSDSGRLPVRGSGIIKKPFSAKDLFMSLDRI